MCWLLYKNDYHCIWEKSKPEVIRWRKTIGSYSKIASNLNFGIRSWGFIILKSEIASCLTVKIRSTRGDWLYFMGSKNKKNHSKKVIICATFMAVFSLASVFAGTFAWFSMNEQVNATGMFIKVAAQDFGIDSVKLHKFN